MLHLGLHLHPVILSDCDHVGRQVNPVHIHTIPWKTGDGGKEETISPARHVEGGASCAAADVQHLHARGETETGTEILCRFFSTDAHIGAAKDGFVSQDSLPGVLVLIKMIKMVKMIKMSRWSRRSRGS